MMRMLLIDNYDSFTYNLVQAFAALGAEVIVHRNDAITVDEARALSPTHLVISPGPSGSVRVGAMSVVSPRLICSAAPRLEKPVPSSSTSRVIPNWYWLRRDMALPAMMFSATVSSMKP